MSSSGDRSRLERQLLHLETLERPRLLAAMGQVDGKDPADQADRMAFELDLAQLERRIQRLNDLLADAEEADLTHGRHDATLVLDFGSGPESYRLGALGIDDTLEVITPQSPLGRALVGAVAGQRVTYATPRGTASVLVVSIGAPAAA